MSAPAPPSPRRWLPWAIGGTGALLLMAAVFGVAVLGPTLIAHPDYASLRDSPDHSLSGTVAYFDDESLCVHVVAASGEPDRQVYCLEQNQPADPMQEGKNVGVDIVWLPDGRLDLTLFRMAMTKDAGPPEFFPAWRRLVDVRSGEVEDVPASQYVGDVPSRTCLTRSPSGEEVVTESDSGHAVVTLVTAAGERTLLDVRGNPETYRIEQACWAPNFEWVYSSDTQFLVITTGEASQTRTLTPEMTSFYGYDALSWYAVTASNPLAK